MNLETIIFNYIKNEHPRIIPSIEIEELARRNGYSGSTGSRKARGISGDDKQIKRLYKTIQRKGRGVRVVRYKFEAIKQQGKML